MLLRITPIHHEIKYSVNATSGHELLTRFSQHMHHADSTVKLRYQFAYHYTRALLTFRPRFGLTAKCFLICDHDGPNSSKFVESVYGIPEPEDPKGGAKLFYERLGETIALQTNRSNFDNSVHIKSLALYVALHELSHEYYKHTLRTGPATYFVSIPLSFAFLSVCCALQPMYAILGAKVFGKLIAAQTSQGAELEADNKALNIIHEFKDLIAQDFNLAEKQIYNEVKESHQAFNHVAKKFGIRYGIFSTHPTDEKRMNLVDLHLDSLQI